VEAWAVEAASSVVEAQGLPAHPDPEEICQRMSVSPRKSIPVKALEAWQLVRQIPLPPQNPDDNYELSDQADSDADETLEAQRRSLKHQPRWSENYLELLKKQSDLDPDTIFGGRVPCCILEDVFTDDLYEQVGKTRPKRKRGSSGNWKGRDQLCPDEIDAYKRKLGQTRVFVPDVQDPPEGLSPNSRRPLPTPVRNETTGS